MTPNIPSRLNETVRANPGAALLGAAVLAVLGIIVVYEINNALTFRERIFLQLAAAKDMADYDALLKRCADTDMERQVLVEKMLFLVRSDSDHKPDYPAAQAILDILNSGAHADSNESVVWAGLIQKQITDNVKFNRQRKAEQEQLEKESAAPPVAPDANQSDATAPNAPATDPAPSAPPIDSVTPPTGN